jgi:hypothetical protein
MKERHNSGYDEQLVEYICEKIATTDLGIEHILEQWLAENGSGPSLRTVWTWLTKYPQFKALYEEAKRMQGELLVYRASIEARTPRIGQIVIEDPIKGITKKTLDNVERSKLIVQTLLKRAGQLAPDKYGEKLNLEHSGEVGVKRVVSDI